MRHANDQIYNRKRHEDDFEVLVAQEGDEEFEQTLGFVKHAIRLDFNAVLNGDVDFVYCGGSHLPVVLRIGHFLALIRSDNAIECVYLCFFLAFFTLLLVVYVYVDLFFFLDDLVKIRGGVDRLKFDRGTLVSIWSRHEIKVAH